MGLGQHLRLNNYFCRLHTVGPAFFGKMERRMYALWAYTLVAAVVVFGAGCGTVAAALIFGAYAHYAASYGQRLRTAASYVSHKVHTFAIQRRTAAMQITSICYTTSNADTDIVSMSFKLWPDFHGKDWKMQGKMYLVLAMP